MDGECGEGEYIMNYIEEEIILTFSGYWQDHGRQGVHVSGVQAGEGQLPCKK